MSEQNILSLIGVRKEYPGVVALDDVTLDIRKGEIHAIAGENGAGKSTLIKILTGAIQPEAGVIKLDGKEYTGFTPHQALFDLGVAAIYQEFNLIPYLSVTQNIFLGKELKKGAALDKKKMRQETEAILERLGVSLNPDTAVRDLGVAYQQVVEIAKAVSNEIRILIMDEPTAPLTMKEVDILMALVKTLREEGITVVYISHRMSENFELADRITVLRDGQYIATLEARDTSRKELFRLMVGREIENSFPAHTPTTAGEPILEVRNLYSQGFLRDISFKLYPGEILGIGGLIGAGRTELAMALFGAEPIDRGEVRVSGSPVAMRHTSDAIRHGICLIPEDRKNHGILGGLTVKENVSYSSLKSISRLTVVNQKEQARIATEYKDRLGIKTPSIEQKAKNLSGGNQQKVVLSKWLATNSNVVLFDEPTRGIDVGAKQEIYELIIKLAESGKGVLLISSEMPELLGMSDRILVMREGEIVGTFDKENATPEAVLELAAHD